MSTNNVRAFCKSPVSPITDFDVKVLGDAEKVEVPFEYGHINCYSWGEGRKVLLVHGWGSRASHLALIARTLSKSGFQVITFDAPAHCSLSETSRNELSNFFEFSRALASVAKQTGPLYAIAGHSLGAIASFFALTGKSLPANYRMHAEKLILMGVPVHLENLVNSFCKNHGLNKSDCLQLKENLEQSFNFSFSDFSVIPALKEINAEILFIHDKDDEEFPIGDLDGLSKSYPEIDIFTTQGIGHHKLVMNRQVIVRIREYLTD